MRHLEGKILLRLFSSEQLPTKAKIFDTFQLKLKIPLKSLNQVRPGYQAFTEHQHEIDRLMTTRVKEQLSKTGLEAKLSPKVRVETMIISRRVDSSY